MSIVVCKYASGNFKQYTIIKEFQEWYTCTCTTAMNNLVTSKTYDGLQSCYKLLKILAECTCSYKIITLLTCRKFCIYIWRLPLEGV